MIIPRKDGITRRRRQHRGFLFDFVEEVFSLDEKERKLIQEESVVFKKRFCQWKHTISEWRRGLLIEINRDREEL